MLLKLEDDAGNNLFLLDMNAQEINFRITIYDNLLPMKI